MKTYKIEAGTISTIYKANSEKEALEAYAKDAGYRSYAYLTADFGEVDSIEEVTAENLKNE